MLEESGIGGSSIPFLAVPQGVVRLCGDGWMDDVLREAGPGLSDPNFQQESQAPLLAWKWGLLDFRGC